MSAPRSNLPAIIGSDAQLTAFAAADEELASPGLSLAQIVCILRAYWRRILLLLIALVTVFGVIIKLMPKSYVATATLIVSRNDPNPLATNNMPAALQYTFIPTQIDLIKSSVVLRPVIDKLHLLNDPEFAGGFKGPPTALREAVLNNLFKALTVYQGPASDLLYVAVASKHPDEAAAIANAIAEEYLKLNRERISQPATQRARVYTQELADLRNKTIQAQKQVITFRQQHGMINLDPSSTDDADTALRNLEQKLLMAQNEERNIQVQMQSGAAGNNQAGGAGEGTTLASEEAKLAKLRASLGPRHPAVLELESEIAAMKQSISSGLSTQLVNAQKLVQRYQFAVDAARRTVLKRRKIQYEGTKLLLELQSAKATYKRALDGYPQIEFASNGDVSDVSLVSRAVPPVLSTKPHKMKYFLASCVLSIGLAFGLPFIYELLLNRRLRCRDDLERHFGIPVLAQFGPISEREPR